MWTHIHRSIIHNIQEVEATQTPTNRETTQNVVYTHSGILFSLEKEGNSDPCYNMDEHEDMMPSEISQAQKGIVYDST